MQDKFVLQKGLLQQMDKLQCRRTGSCIMPREQSPTIFQTDVLQQETM